jgi:S1-C subfamily serine protease
MSTHSRVALALAGALIFCVPAQAMDLVKLGKQALGPTVQLNRNCSGEIVYSSRDEKSGDVTTYILTAKHCTTDTADKVNEAYIPVYDKGRVVSELLYKADVVSQYYKHDLALLKLKDTKTSFADRTAKLAARDVDPPIGAPVVTIGYPYGLTLTANEGTFGARGSIPFPSDTKDTEYFRASPGVAGGNSGGGLYRITDSGDFELLGVTDLKTGGKETSQGGFYVPVDVIYEFLTYADSKAFPEEKKPAAEGAGGH